MLVGPDTVGSFRVYVTSEIIGDDQRNRPLTFVLKDETGTAEIDSQSSSLSRGLCPSCCIGGLPDRPAGLQRQSRLNLFACFLYV